MATILSRMLRASTRREGEPLNILLMGATHERWETGLAATGHNFFAVQAPGLKAWDTRFSPVPPNVTFLPGLETPIDLAVDVVVSQTRLAQFHLARQLAASFHAPHVNVAHTYPGQGSPSLRADLNVFISDDSRREWGFADDGLVVEHGVDTDLFRPRPGSHRSPRVLAVANLFAQRDAELGYSFWKEATEGLPVLVVGDNPGLSEPAPGPRELAFAYQTSLVFASTAQRSPLPMSLLEAMASGCAVLTTRNPVIESVIEDGKNGVLCDTPGDMARAARVLLSCPAMALRMGREARRTVERRFTLGRHASDWNNVFETAASLALTGD